MKAIIISRVSTEEQREAGNSLPAQTARLEKYRLGKGFDLLKKFEFDESAYKTKRDDFDNILDFVIAQKEKVVVCFDKVDRLSRNVFDKRVSILYDKALSDQIELHFVSDGQVVNSQISAVEKFHFGISLGLAKYYSDAISDNVKRVQEQKLRMGFWPHKAPFGYKNITLDNGKKDIVVDEYKSRIALKVYEWYGSKTSTYRLILKNLKDEYNIKWSMAHLADVLSNTFYIGVMNWHGKLYPHGYELFINKELFDRVQEVRDSHNKKKFKYAGKPYFYRGLLRCGQCGCAITPEKHKGHVYYHCTQYKGKHNAGWLREDKITEQIADKFKKHQIPQEHVNEIISSLKETQENKMEFHNKQFDVLTKKKKELTQSLDNLYLDKLKGSITESEHARFFTNLNEQSVDIDTRLSMLQEAQDNYFITANYILELTQKAYKLFLSSEIEERRQLLKLVFSNLTMEGKKVQFEAQKPFDTILSFADSPSWGHLPCDVRTWVSVNQYSLGFNISAFS